MARCTHPGKFIDYTEILPGGKQKVIHWECPQCGLKWQDDPVDL